MAELVLRKPKRSQERIDVGAWKSLSSKTRGDGHIPALLEHNTHCCNCKYCRVILKETKCWTQARKEDINVDIKIGDRVLIQEMLPGVVKYVGDLDSVYTNGAVYVGVKLDDCVGDHDGVFNNKRYFECPQMHGVIAPIEDVNLLVPTDGRSIKPNRFFSMPSYDLDSLTSLESWSSDPEVVQRTVSENRLSTPLPDYHFDPSASIQSQRPQSGKKCSRSQSGKNCSRPQSEKRPQSGKKKRNSKKLCHEDGVTRSGVFICDAPGSIAAEIGGLDPDTKKRLLASLSLHKNTITDNLGEKIIIQSATNVPPTPPSSPTVPKAYTAQPTSSSISAVHNKKPLVRFVVGSSNSIVTDLKKPCSPPVSKLVTNKVAAMRGGTVKKEPYVTGPAVSEDPLASVEDPPVIPKLRLPLSDDTQSVANEKPLLHTATSFTGQMLSGLPYRDAITPQPGSVCKSDEEELQEWVDKWGGGLAGWTKAHTLQKLRDAQRKGQKELEWQMKVDELEKNDLYTPRVKNIQELRDEIVKARERYKSTHLQLEQCKATLSCSELSKQIDQLEDQTQRLREMNECLLGKVLDHPLFDVVREAVQYLGLDINHEGRLHEVEEGQAEAEAEGATEVLDAQPV